ncbi:Hypothetical predicted protein [Marmota monax]|uniref:Uncharacterized protein n=1 Tax=Marmota monax TaxID=9995 RepID=A0A5E4BIA7_MARMO|nr:Hypothetical predicted protein [Marmota monax]
MVTPCLLGVPSSRALTQIPGSRLRGGSGSCAIPKGSPSPGEEPHGRASPSNRLAPVAQSRASSLCAEDSAPAAGRAGQVEQEPRGHHPLPGPEALKGVNHPTPCAHP